MDIPRPKVKRHRTRVLVIIATAVVLLTTLGLSQLRPASPEIERATLLIDAVKRGPMLRQVHANGTLVPEDQRFVSALTAGRVDKVLVRPGATVGADDVLVELSNPDVQLEALDSERQLKLAEADLASLRSTLETARLAQTSALASARTEKREAERAVAVAERLAKDGLSSAMEVERATDRLTEAKERFEMEEKRLELANEALKAQIELRKADAERLRAIARFQQERVTSMRVKAGAAGQVQQLDLQPGQWVQSGQPLARVATPDRLKAVLQIPESQARDIALGLPATIDTRNGVVKGRVVRIDPGVQNGSVAVDIAFDGPLPRGARPDLGIDGTIVIERIAEVLSVGRPALGGSETTLRLFRLEPDGHTAVRVPVQLGRASFDAVEILAGLREGDRVILSEMSRWDHTDRVRLR
ncbi:MAG TPA: HlyD family efflux transporter periplasmic adaptor subunit [Candidatus Eisenbacteria bacterium]|nr:HlyD family efflux transporter periplasmic adaptor subunit [Candidatus Eisenbacteria bacterium]